MAKEKEHLNLAFIGHVDHGKSTLVGHLLLKAGAIAEQQLDDGENKFRFVMDKLGEERERGVTIDLAHQKFSTNKYDYTVVDCPGHRDFVKNMITGASQADAAVLVVDAKDGVMPQTKEHMFLSMTLGIKQIIIAINKMDMVDYAEDRFNEVKEIIASKKPGQPEPRALLDLKGAIRRAEAKSAVRSFGLNDATNCHFLNLPFYETGGIKKGERTQADIDIITELLQKVQPHQIYLAGDLADPHGTHRVCTEAVLESINQLKNEEWMKECHVWLYRGAWMEWEIGKVDMAVPLSPDEVIKKRHAIYRHLSQKDIVPFPGEDPREFWQRAEERTGNTARLYDKLGMAEYQAIEVFVKLF